MRYLFHLISLLLIFGSCTNNNAQSPTPQKPELIPFEMQRGVNICHWLSQSDDRGEARKRYFTETDVKALADAGFDHLRLPIDEVQLFNEDGTMIGEAFELLHNGVQWCIANDVRVIVDLHVVRSHHFNEGTRPLWSSLEEQDKLVALWQLLSSELKEYSTDYVAYELLNEPVASSDVQWNGLANRLIKVIRAEEPTRKILVGSNRWQMIGTLKNMTLPRNDNNLILSFHFYEPHLLTHYRAEWSEMKDLTLQLTYPGKLVSDEEYAKLSTSDKKLVEGYRKEYNKEVFSEIIDEAVAVAQEYGYQLHCGEFGCYNKIPEAIRLQWTKDIIELLYDKGIAYSYWGYKGGFGFANDQGVITNAPLRDILTGKK